jgi:hypothetical protein
MRASRSGTQAAAYRFADVPPTLDRYGRMDARRPPVCGGGGLGLPAFNRVADLQVEPLGRLLGSLWVRRPDRSAHCTIVDAGPGCAGKAVEADA